MGERELERERLRKRDREKVSSAIMRCTVFCFRLFVVALAIESFAVAATAATAAATNATAGHNVS